MNHSWKHHSVSPYESVFENPARVHTEEYVDVELARINPPA